LKKQTVLVIITSMPRIFYFANKNLKAFILVNLKKEKKV